MPSAFAVFRLITSSKREFLNIRHVARIATVKNLDDLHNVPANRTFDIPRIRHQSAGLCLITERINCGNPELLHQFNQQEPIGVVLAVLRKNNSIDLISLEGTKDTPVLCFVYGAPQWRKY